MKLKHIVFQGIFAIVLLNAIARGGDGDPNQSQDPNAISGVTIALTSFDVNEAQLELHYQIRNESNDKAWICKSISQYEAFETFVTNNPNDPNEGPTLHIRRQLDVPTPFWYVAPPEGRNVRLDVSETLQETIAVPIPVQNCKKGQGGMALP